MECSVYLTLICIVLSEIALTAEIHNRKVWHGFQTYFVHAGYFQWRAVALDPRVFSPLSPFLSLPSSWL